jgi:hypothetical protein
MSHEWLEKAKERKVRERKSKEGKERKRKEEKGRLAAALQEKSCVFDSPGSPT